MILIDLNVLLDVIQQRQPHYHASGVVLTRIINGHAAGLLPAHAFTTIHYIVGRYRDRDKADAAIDWLLNHFEVAAIGARELKRARELNWPDFEDAVVAATAQTNACQTIVTRNVDDFQHSPIAALTPHEYLLENDV